MQCLINEQGQRRSRYSLAEDTKAAFRLTGLAGSTSQFLNGTHELSELVLARMALLMDQNKQIHQERFRSLSFCPV